MDRTRLCACFFVPFRTSNRRGGADLPVGLAEDNAPCHRRVETFDLRLPWSQRNGHEPHPARTTAAGTAVVVLRLLRRSTNGVAQTLRLRTDLPRWVGGWVGVGV